MLYSYTLGDVVDVHEGQQVELPVGNHVANGMIMTIFENKISDKNLKPIIGSIKNTPSISNDLRKLIGWFYNYYQCTPFKAFQTLIGKKKLRKLPEAKEYTVPLQPDITLSDEQSAALQQIFATEGYRSFLLEGITSSGKTEVYIQVVHRLLPEGKTSLILVPEIALTPQFTEIFTRRFGETVSVIHSGLTAKEKEIEWNRIYQGQAQIVIGPRSAIFAPLSSIGAIIIDEEHESTYKQENHPRYYAHTIAEERAKEHSAILIYGSATPNVDLTGKENPEFTRVTLKKRIHNRPLPDVKLVDMREELRERQRPLLSLALENAIAEAIDKKEKSIVLLNRRGYAPYVICGRCAEVYVCPHCKLSYTQHKDKSLRCHRCAIQVPMTYRCPSCKKNALMFSGVGIQKAEFELKRRFPNASIYRLDKDSASNPKTLHSILDGFKKEGDILIGTQMIAKGHHIAEVTVVGILGIDTTLNLPDFRAPERAFQLITQCAGRAGRGEQPGHVVVQTFQPEHYAVQHAAEQNYQAFFEQEMAYRKELSYPPFVELINILFSSKNEAEARSYGKTLEQYFKEHKENLNFSCLGPKPAPFEKVREYYRWHLLIKVKKSDLPELKERISRLPPAARSLRVVVDYDPRSIL